MVSLFPSATIPAFLRLFEEVQVTFRQTDRKKEVVFSAHGRSLVWVQCLGSHGLCSSLCGFRRSCRTSQTSHLLVCFKKYISVILQNVTYPLCNQRLDITGESCSPDYHMFPCDFGDTLQNPFEQNLIFYAHIYILQLSEAHRCKPNHFCCAFLLVLAESSMCAETQSQCQCLFSGQCSVFSGPPRVLHGWHPLRFGASGSSHGLGWRESARGGRHQPISFFNWGWLCHSARAPGRGRHRRHSLYVEHTVPKVILFFLWSIAIANKDMKLHHSGSSLPRF